ncbi:MAG: hypothetical protein AAF693_15015 [Bacteroidota bacterium]
MDSIEEIRHLITEDIYIIPEAGDLKYEIAIDDRNENVVNEPDPKEYISGNTSGHVLIIAELPLSEVHSTLLSKIMAAVKISFDDLAFMKLSKAGLLGELDQFPKYILLFGDTNALDFLPPSKYEAFEFKSKTFLQSASLDVLENSVVDKKKLWSALQTIFLA